MLSAPGMSLPCELCGGPVGLFELDKDGYHGMPAHEDCVRALREAVAMIEREGRPAMHRTRKRYPSERVPADDLPVAPVLDAPVVAASG